MENLFFNTDFNQDISGWDVSYVTNYMDFSMGSALSTENIPDFP